MPFSKLTHVRRKQDVLFRVIDGEAVLLNLASGTYFGLNAVGTRIWELLGDDKSASEISLAIVREFDVESSVVEVDVEELLQALSEKGLVERYGG